MTPAVSSVGTEHGEYAHLVAVQRRYAQLGGDGPDRQQLREQLIIGYLPVAEHIARRYAGRGEPLDDLIQVATVGLIKAVDRFDPDRGSDFFSFAIPTITGELRRYFRDHGWSTRVPRRLRICILPSVARWGNCPSSWVGHRDPARSPTAWDYRSRR